MFLPKGEFEANIDYLRMKSSEHNFELAFSKYNEESNMKCSSHEG